MRDPAKLSNVLGLKLAYFLKNLQTYKRENNSKIPRIKNYEIFRVLFLYEHERIGKSQICISVPLTPCLQTYKA